MKKSTLSLKFLLLAIILASHGEAGTSYNHNQYGHYGQGLKTQQKPVLINGFEFNKLAKKDLKRLSSSAAMRGTKLIEEDILTGKITGSIKVNIGNQYKFHRFYTSDGAYILAWEIIENKVTVLAIGPHENFYKEFRRRYDIRNKSR